MKIDDLDITDAQLYLVSSSLDVKSGISIKVKALPLAVKKEKIWSFPKQIMVGFRHVWIEDLGKIDDERFKSDTLFNKYFGFCLKEDVESFIEKLRLRHVDDILDADDKIAKVKHGILSNRGKSVKELF